MTTALGRLITDQWRLITDLKLPGLCHTQKTPQRFQGCRKKAGEAIAEPRPRYKSAQKLRSGILDESPGVRSPNVMLFNFTDPIQPVNPIPNAPLPQLHQRTVETVLYRVSRSTLGSPRWRKKVIGGSQTNFTGLPAPVTQVDTAKVAHHPKSVNRRPGPTSGPQKLLPKIQ